MNASTLVKQIEGAIAKQTSALIKTLLGFPSVPPRGSSHTGTLFQAACSARLTPQGQGPLLQRHGTGVVKAPSLRTARPQRKSQNLNLILLDQPLAAESENPNYLFLGTQVSRWSVWVPESDLGGNPNSVANELYDNGQVV